MKQDSTLQLLATLQVMLALLVAALCAWHIYGTRVLNRQGLRLAESVHNRRVYDVLLAASIDYAKRQAAIHPTLQAVGVTITTNAAPKAAAPIKSSK